MKKTITVILLLLAIAAMLMLSSCQKEPDTALPDERAVDYTIENVFEVSVQDSADARVYAPKDKDARYGLIFYVGTFIEPQYYPYIASALAAQGYLVVIPKVDLYLAYFSYRETEPAFDAYPDVTFFVGGHSQGGGAAIRRASEEQEHTLGVILLSPLAYGSDTLADTNTKVLLIEAENDTILTDEMKADARTRLPQDCQYHRIKGGNHMGYSDLDLPFADGTMTITKKEMQQEAAEQILLFIRFVLGLSI